MAPNDNVTSAEKAEAGGAGSEKPGSITASLKRAFAERVAGPEGPHVIRDHFFWLNLKRLHELRTFLLQEAVPLKSTGGEPLLFGDLNLLRYDERGRTPTREEWEAVEGNTQTLFELMTPELRRRFILGTIPGWVSAAPIVLMIFALAALVLATFFQQGGAGSPVVNLGLTIFPFYLVWLVCLGAIGAIAFLGMNALSIQNDATFDLTNRRLMVLRIVLGSLFGLVFALPLGIDSFATFIKSITQLGVKDAPKPESGTILLLIAPLVLGFSTTLVITIMNRLVDAVQAFFGRSGSKTSDEEHSQINSRLRGATKP